VLCLVHHVHTNQWRQHFPAPLARAGELAERRAMPFVYRRHQYLADSPSTAHDLERLGIARERIHVLPVGVDLPEPAATHPESEEPLFIALGRLVPHKRIDLLLDAWERVRPQVGGRLVIAGDGPERERLQARAGPGAELVGFVSDEERQRLLSSAWLLLHPAQHEGWGIAIMEAAGAGTPAIGFDVAGVRDAIADGVSGILASSTDDFVAAWIDLARDADGRRALAAGARARAAEFTWDRMVDKFLEAAGAVLGGEPRASEILAPPAIEAAAPPSVPSGGRG
jgi:glycosyltransferase involved in cell wall biosynthesis